MEQSEIMEVKIVKNYVFTICNFCEIISTSTDKDEIAKLMEEHMLENPMHRVHVKIIQEEE